MDKVEINKTITEYMGVELTEYELACNTGEKETRVPFTYTESLDALVSVVEKLNSAMSFYYNTYSDTSKWVAVIDVSQPVSCNSCGRLGCEMASENSKSPSFALATACAKVIKELEPGNSDE